MTDFLIDMGWLEELTIARKVLLAMVLGGLIGWEREAASKPAGRSTTRSA